MKYHDQVPEPAAATLNATESPPALKTSAVAHKAHAPLQSATSSGSGSFKQVPLQSATSSGSGSFKQAHAPLQSGSSSGSESFKQARPSVIALQGKVCWCC